MISDSPISAEIFELATRVFPDGGMYLEAGAHDGIFFQTLMNLKNWGVNGEGYQLNRLPRRFNYFLKIG